MAKNAYRRTGSNTKLLLAVVAAVLVVVLALWSRSITTALFATFVVVIVVAIAIIAARMAGIDRHHPAVQAVLSRPWRDGPASIDAIVKTMRRAFVVGPRGEILAPATLIVDAAPETIAALVQEYTPTFLSRLLDTHWIAELEAANATPMSSDPLRVFLEPVAGMAKGTFHARRGSSVGDLAPGVLTATGTIVLSETQDRPEHQRSGAPGASPQIPVVPARLDTDGDTDSDADSDADAGTDAETDANTATRGRHWAEPMAAPQARAVAPAGAPPVEVTPGRNVTPRPRYDATTIEPARTSSTTHSWLHADPSSARPTLALVTDGARYQTSSSPATAGRHPRCHLILPARPTISRENATFTWRDGHWWVEAHGTNNVLLNGTTLSGEHVVGDGDVLQWGSSADAVASLVQIEV